ncbi:MAG: hypothetical protein KatS3mg097_378 [Candidatus Parcubacteria bacterium]|nr:MAG: hypothetical protein KatS3mg097_378 [Candidatus Parcubacteria bacterium]
MLVRKKFLFIYLIFILIIPIYNFYVLSGSDETAKVEISFVTYTAAVCPPSILGIPSSRASCTFPSIVDIIATTSNFIISELAPLTLVILIIIGGFLYILMVFQPSFLELGHKYIQWGIYGYVILLLIFSILVFIQTTFTPSP